MGKGLVTRGGGTKRSGEAIKKTNWRERKDKRKKSVGGDQEMEQFLLPKIREKRGKKKQQRLVNKKQKGQAESSSVGGAKILSKKKNRCGDGFQGKVMKIESQGGKKGRILFAKTRTGGS